MISIDESVKGLLEEVKQSMEDYFVGDKRRIDHALQVTEYSRELLQYIDADPLQTLCAAYLHDIGILESERKYGQCTGKQQELEGPPVAKKLLSELGVDDDLIEKVCALVSKHHTPAGIDSPEFRILWDADALVNLVEVVDDKSPDQIEEILRRSLVTEPGYRRARNVYL